MLKRFAHRMRFKKSLNLVPVDRDIRLLDFGCGDRLFLNSLNAKMGGGGGLIGYEPYMDSISGNFLTIMKNWTDIKQMQPFNCITCFEVLEHFTQNKQQEVLREMYSILTNDGILIVSVPIEKGFPSVVKNIIRRLKYKDKTTYSIKNIVASFYGNPLPEFRQGKEYLNHLGFYYQDLESVFLQYFDVVEKCLSPFPFLGYNANSQIFYKLKKRNI
jgi:cyclopropane fatty-acyl-phospholipid synthase-like methyltransferase